MTVDPIKRNSTPTVTDTLKRNGTAINLSGCTVSLCLENTDTGARFKRSATIVSAAAGTVSCALVAADTAVAGNYRAEWEIINGSTEESVPSAEYIEFEVLADLG